MQKPIDILYIGNNRLPSEKADGLYVMKLCEAFAKQGACVILLVPKRVNPIRDDPFSYYGVQKNFAIRSVPSLDLLFLSKVPLPVMKFVFLLQAVTFGIAAAFFARRWTAAAASEYAQKIIISHEPYSLFFLGFGKHPAIPVAFDLHVGVKQNFFWRRACKIVTNFFVLTTGVAKTVKTFGARAPIVISPDAVDLELFGRDCTRQDARKQLGLSQNMFLSVYTGHLYAWKGIDTMLDAAQFLPRDVMIYCVGGIDDDISKFQNFKIKNGRKNIIFAGRKPHTEMPHWLCAADVLLLPNSGKEAISRLYTSPMKMFEYMAAGKPIVASRLQSITEILSEANAELVEADNPRSLAEGIMRLKNDPIRAKRLAEQAKKDVLQYSWEKKAENILNAFRV